MSYRRSSSHPPLSSSGFTPTFREGSRSTMQPYRQIQPNYAYRRTRNRLYPPGTFQPVTPGNEFYDTHYSQDYQRGRARYKQAQEDYEGYLTEYNNRRRNHRQEEERTYIPTLSGSKYRDHTTIPDLYEKKRYRMDKYGLTRHEDRDSRSYKNTFDHPDYHKYGRSRFGDLQFPARSKNKAPIYYPRHHRGLLGPADYTEEKSYE